MLRDVMRSRRVHRRAARGVVAMLDARVPGFLSSSGAAGVSIALSTGHKFVRRAYGIADKEAGRAMTDRTVFRMGSIAKPVSAFGIMHLHHAGVVDLDEPVGRYLRSWSLGDVPGADQVTLRRILSHSAGLGVPRFGVVPWMDPNPDTAAILSGACGEGTVLRLVDEPGASAQYSGGGYILGQMVAEDVTGRPFGAFMREAVFGPLGVERTSYSDTAGELAAGHARDGSRVARVFLPTASSALCSTPSDLVRLWDALVPGPRGELPGRGIISPEDAAMMRRCHASERDGPKWGLGFSLGSSRLGPIYQHSGWTAGWWARAMGFESRNISLVVAINSETGHDWGGKLVREIISALC